MTVALLSHEPLDVAPSDKHDVILFQGAAKLGTGNGIELALSPGSSPFEMADHDGLRFSIVMGEVHKDFRDPGCKFFTNFT